MDNILSESVLSSLKALGVLLLSDSKDVCSYAENVTGYRGRPAAVVVLDDVDKVVDIVSICNQHGLSVYPISRGANWGLGSKLPVGPGQILLDLSKADSIVDYSNEFGYITVEPGVTQKQVYEFLRSKCSDYYIDVTGSGEGSSIIGNALERGVAYNTSRIESIMSFKVVLGTGEVLETGALANNNRSLHGVYRFSTGPDFTNIFTQSNYGVVIGATVKLIKKPRYCVTYNIAIKDDESLPDFIQTVRQLIDDKCLDGIPHVFDRERLHSGVSPLLYKLKFGTDLSKRAQIDDFVRAMFSGCWWMVGSIQGDKDVVHAKIKVLKRTLSKFSKINIMSPLKIRVAGLLSRFFPSSGPCLVFKATEALRDFPFGRPCNESLYSVFWPFSEKLDFRKLVDPDKSDSGYIFIVPGVPLDFESVKNFVRVLNMFRQDDKCKIAASLNPINSSVGEGVVSLAYPKTVEGIERAFRVEKSMRSEFRKHFSFIRLGIGQMEEVSYSNAMFSRQLKSFFDPNKVISPGRYE